MLGGHKTLHSSKKGNGFCCPILRGAAKPMKSLRGVIQACSVHNNSDGNRCNQSK